MAEILSAKPLCFTVSVSELEKYGWAVAKQLRNNPDLEKIATESDIEVKVKGRKRKK